MHDENDREARPPNRLINEKSPYLLQHAHNPVEWFPWSDEAFELAEKQDKPVFLSIGYSTCHWCHVMERESFQDPEVAALMNDAFICIKVDREERPDLDNIYMAAAQMISGHGGWPLTILMTPDKRPFYAATYLPRETAFGRMGMTDLAPRIKELWRTQREKLTSVAGQVMQELERPPDACGGEAPDEGDLHDAYLQLERMYDPDYGGFGQAPKFPTPHNLYFLMRYYKRTANKHALGMVEKTLDAMIKGGIHDQLGYGFHRYSTDRSWLVPHFEKMLYDQALISMALVEGWQLFAKEDYMRAAGQVFVYVMRDMTSPQGAFLSAEDADSEGEEGRFYLWTKEEIQAALAPQEVRAVTSYYNVDERGNFRDEATGAETGKNILHVRADLEETAAGMKMKKDQLKSVLASARDKLFHLRKKRVRPFKDDKVMADWNGLMIAALAKGARAFGRPEYASAAARAADFILSNMRCGSTALFHRYRQGQAAIPAFLDDYAFMVWGMIELYEATFEPRWLKSALELNAVMLDRFHDRAAGGFFFTAAEEDSPVRKKDAFDGALPSGNSVAAMNLLRLGRITGKGELEKAAENTLNAFCRSARRMPAGFTHMLCSLDFAIGPASEVVLAGDPEADDTRKMVRELFSRFLPNKVVILRPLEQEPEIESVCRYVRDLKPKNGKATVYVCKNFKCGMPVTDPHKMIEILEKES